MSRTRSTASPSPALDEQARIAAGLALTAMPFANGEEADLDCWLRILRLHGEAGAALQSLGVGEAALSHEAPQGGQTQSRGERFSPDVDPESRVKAVLSSAAQIASERDAALVSTADMLRALRSVYGEQLDRALEARGTDRAEVWARLSRRKS
jgi:hypothetical protein